MVRLFCMLFAAFSLSACGGTGAPADPGAAQTGTAETETAESQATESTESDQEGSALKITVGDQELLATFADNSSAEEFRELLSQGPLTIEMELSLIHI